MYVSSYNTYIQTNTSKINEKEKLSQKEGESSFSSKLFKEPALKLSSLTNLPIDYTKGKSSKNQQEIQRQLQNSEEQFKQEKLTKVFADKQKLQNASVAYKDNSKIFSLLQKPQTKTIDQTPKTDTKLPKNIQELKEENMRRVMVNAYTQNDKYYQITA